MKHGIRPGFLITLVKRDLHDLFPNNVADQVRAVYLTGLLNHGNRSLSRNFIFCLLFKLSCGVAVP